MSIIYSQNLALPPFNRTEIMRYCGVGKDLPQLDELLSDCIKEAENLLEKRICFSEFNISTLKGVLDLGFAETNSETLLNRLSGCDRIILFGATLGTEIDRLVARYSRISPSRALIIQGIGTERIEAVCNAFEKEIKARYMHTLPRVSPGYGDIPLELQRDIFSALDCSKKIGLSLNDSLLMSPTKSVTAIIGVNTGEVYGY